MFLLIWPWWLHAQPAVATSMSNDDVRIISNEAFQRWLKEDTEVVNGILATLTHIDPLLADIERMIRQLPDFASVSAPMPAPPPVVSEKKHRQRGARRLRNLAADAFHSHFRSVAGILAGQETAGKTASLHPCDFSIHLIDFRRFTGKDSQLSHANGSSGGSPVTVRQGRNQLFAPCCTALPRLANHEHRAGSLIDRSARSQ